MRENQLKRLWEANKIALNAWLTIPSAWTAEVMAQIGYDCLTIDLQHGLIDYQTALGMLQAISTTPVVPLVRSPWNEPSIIMRLLDAGAYGVICPMVNSRAEAEAFVQACRYPPAGVRSYGPSRATVYAGSDYFSSANETVLTLAMIETAEALERVEDIAATPGLDGFYVGPVDLSISLGLSEKGDFGHPRFKAALDKILKAAKANKLVTGIHTLSPDNVAGLVQLGFELLTPATDTNLLDAAARNALAQARRALDTLRGR
jgi:4-hydroxy-2-oxoheptanedioate aldolase